MMPAAKPRAYASVILPANKEAVFGAPSGAFISALDSSGLWIPVSEADFATSDYDLIDNSDELTGWALPTTHDVQQMIGEVSRKYLASSEVLAWLLAMQLGTVSSSAASSASDEVQTITVSGGSTSGAFVITFMGRTTAAIATSGLSSAAIQTALNALSNVEPADFVVAGTGPYTITAQAAGQYNDKQIEQMQITVVETLNPAGSVTIATTTEGGAAGVYTHTIKFPTECVLNPPSFSMVEGLRCAGFTGTYKLITGCTIDQVDLDISSKGYINLSSSIKHTGIEQDQPSFTFPAAATQYTKLRGNKLSVFLGPAYTDEIPSNLLRNLKISVNSGLIVPPTIGGTEAIPEYQYGEKKPDITCSLSIQGDKASAYYDYFVQSRFGTRYKFKFVIEPNVTPQRRVTFTADQAFVKAKIGKEGNETRLNLDLMFEANTTDSGPGQFAIQTDQSAYLQAI
jgi:hypothetical protein